MAPAAAPIPVTWPSLTFSIVSQPTMAAQVAMKEVSIAMAAELPAARAEPPYGVDDDGRWPAVTLFALFQALFACLTVAIVSGAAADRMKFAAWMAFATVWAVLVSSASRLPGARGSLTTSRSPCWAPGCCGPAGTPSSCPSPSPKLALGPTPGPTSTAGKEAGANRKEAIRSLKRRLSDTINRAMLADAQAQEGHQLRAA